MVFYFLGKRKDEGEEGGRRLIRLKREGEVKTFFIKTLKWVWVYGLVIILGPSGFKE